MSNIFHHSNSIFELSCTVKVFNHFKKKKVETAERNQLS